MNTSDTLPVTGYTVLQDIRLPTVTPVKVVRGMDPAELPDFLINRSVKCLSDIVCHIAIKLLHIVNHI